MKIPLACETFMAVIIEGKLFLVITSISSGASIFTSFIHWSMADLRHFLLEKQNDWLDSILQRISGVCTRLMYTLML